MAQDYWHGGWANGGMLPGTRAAMTARQAGGSYGPLNALADILGAYWQKKDRDDANKAVEDYENNFDSLVSPQEAPQVSAPSVLEGLTGGQEQSLIQPGQFGSKEWGEQNLQPQPKPLSVSEYAKNAKTAMSKAARNLARKYGYGNMQDAIKELQDITNQRVLSYAGQARDNFYNSLNQNGGPSQASLPALLKQADEYNGVVTALGGTPINLKDVISMFANKVANVDAGGKIVQMATAANGLPYYNVPETDNQGNVIGYRPRYTMPAGNVPKSLNPYQEGSLRETNRHNRATEGETQRHNRTSEGINAANAQTARDKYNLAAEVHKYKAENGLYGNGGSGKITQAQRGAANSLEMKGKEIRQLYSQGENTDYAFEDYLKLINDAYGKGLLDDEDVDYYKNKMLALQGEEAKAKGDDDRAASLWAGVSDEVWDKYYAPTFGKRPGT